MISIKNLSKSFGEIEALKNISFNIEEGEIFGLLGPNGAGKTTTLNIIATIAEPATGEVLVEGLDVRKHKDKIRSLIGVVPQEVSIYPQLTAEENLFLFGRLFGLRGKKLKQKVRWGLNLAALGNRAHDRVETYSGGMKRRINIACSLIYEPKILLLDEPTVGIDPQSRHLIYELIHDLNKKGIAILLSTHYIEEAEKLCHRVAIIDEGSLIALDTPEKLISMVGKHDLIELEAEEFPDNIEGIVGENFPNSKPMLREEKLFMTVEDSNRQLPTIIKTLISEKISIISARVRKANLESVFLHLTGKELRE
jgi:ABC-2 type transport system ATP-binding protein